MGKKTRTKNDQKELDERKAMSAFAHHNHSSKIKAIQTLNEPRISIQLNEYCKSWLNNPHDYTVKTKSSNKDKQLLEIVRHCLAKYPVCKPLTNLWSYKPTAEENRFNREQEYAYRHQHLRGRYGAHHGGGHVIGAGRVSTPIPDADFKAWYICVAQGGSLYKKHAKEHLTKKEVHTFLTCQHDFEIAEALFYAVAKTHCGKEGPAMRVCKSKISHNTFDPFWRSVARFFAEHPTESLQQVNDLVDFIVHKLQEAAAERRAGRNVEFTMAGHTVESLVKKMHDWHYALRRIKVMGEHSWAGVYLPDSKVEKRNPQDPNRTINWHFHQIKNSKELAAEGNRMRHCVFSYRDRCIQDHLSIWTMGKEEFLGSIQPKITIELSNSGNIVQARGLANRSPRPEEIDAINTWANQNGLTFRKGYY